MVDKDMVDKDNNTDMADTDTAVYILHNYLSKNLKVPLQNFPVMVLQIQTHL